ncbi:hypothetical protein Sfulv_44090 [Streptomyces fulvorobeus]|uniref:ATPase n=1 Tax=Streptomyces fulvorobeus TaxID=284028 RepID=A0A7J0CB22_9ACTN|nr:hypothetical protein Sfulv_44090 [Streptomyces fulvorobeus]
MTRSNEGSPAQPERGNFTPPQRAGASSAELSAPEPAGGSTSRLAPRNWRVPTRLNAILLIPALVGLIMGGFQVKGSVDTWNEAQDAERTALIVRAASEYGQALLNERDLTAQPLLSNKRTAEVVEGPGPPRTRPGRSSTRPFRTGRRSRAWTAALSCSRSRSPSFPSCARPRTPRAWTR